ncbi:MAG TPA: L,D-transpeptidase family protein [Bacteroidia bacterium]|nr:L,D-transpeptidase family protein [Bacteroidia bacterium]HNU33204.1 L,D-transpeptidase family protein [Bacteroidia bacterium]
MYSRVREAFNEKEIGIKNILKTNGIVFNNMQVLFVAFKKEGLFEVYAKNKKDTVYKLITTYKICSSSGELGPKRAEGDGQVPEGFYYINRFNPVSSFHLSLGINYPNISDRKLSTAPRLGGDIYIHGSCVTIGCVPLTDEIIKHVYVYAVKAKSNGQEKIPVYIFPFKMENETYRAHLAAVSANTSLVVFWENLKKGFDLFDTRKRELSYYFNGYGEYVFR